MEAVQYVFDVIKAVIENIKEIFAMIFPSEEA